jgi:hypothetical protein
MMKYMSAFTGLILLFCAKSVLSVDPLTLGVAIDQAEKSLNSVVDNSREAGDFLIARTAQELLFLLDSFEASNQKLLKTAFELVGQERRQFIGGIEKAIGELNTGVVTTLDRSERVVDQAYQLVKDVTFDTYPTIFRYRGSVVVPGQTADIRLSIRGANLSHGQPYLVLDGKSYPAERPTTQDLIVTIPRSVISHDDNSIIYKNGKLIISYESGGFLGFFTDEEKASYDIGLIVLPNNLGSASITYDVLGTARRERTYTGEWSHRGGSGCRSFSQAPAAQGRRFDPDRSSITRHSGNQRGEGRSITIRDTGMSMAICVSRGLLDRDDGFAHYRYSFLEYWTEPTATPSRKELKVAWLTDGTATIGTNVDKVILTFTDFTGKETKHTPSSNPAAQYGEISFDDQGVILLRPKIPRDLAAL